MNDLVFFYPEGHEAHFNLGHPERPERVEAIREAMESAGLWAAYPHLDPVELPEAVLHNIHTPAYLQTLEQISKQGRNFDLDTYTTPASWDLALKAAGGAAAVASAVWRREAKRGFALTRPPGHHATPDRALGFCLLNNISLAAEYLIQEMGAKKLAIVDLDLHHGNGTQEIFYRRGDVFYLSTHQSPLYPGTGRLDETGAGPGQGRNANFPLPPYSGDQAFQTVMRELILPLLDRYQPEMILVSYGFDPHWSDPLGHLRLCAPVYGNLIAQLVEWADDHCSGRVSMCLEGGYDLDAAKTCSLAAVAALLGKPPEIYLEGMVAAGTSPRPEGMDWRRMVDLAKEIWNL
jgi:acetoin utilization deacetylase AcuC-like enzyme